MCITVLGEFDSVLRVGSRKHTEQLYVVDQTNPLLCREACVKLGYITYHVSDVNTNDCCSEFEEMFQECGQVSVEYDRLTRDLPGQSKSVDAVESPRKQSVASTQTDTNTHSCGYVKHYNSTCPVINVTCNLCSTTGHYVLCCRHKAQTRKPQYNAKINQLVVDADRDNASFLCELVMGRKLRPTVTAHPNVLPPKLPNAVHIRQKEVELKASSKFNFGRKHRVKELPLSP